MNEVKFEKEKEDAIKKLHYGFDRGVDFLEMKDKLLSKQRKYRRELRKANTKYEKRCCTNRIAYVMVAMLQLRNGSRISEACDAFTQYVEGQSLDDKVAVKIAKSTGQQYSRRLKKMIEKKIRFRKMIFPDWIDVDLFEKIRETKFMTLLVNSQRFKKRVLDFLLLNLDCNTHSLRYAFINYMLNDQKIEMNTVSKTVGHINCLQLTTYTQRKNIDKVLEMDI